MTPKSRVTIKVNAPQGLKEKLQHEAEQRHVSMAALIRLILTEYLKNKG